MNHELLLLQVEAYWCFKHYMDHVQADFMEDCMPDKLSECTNCSACSFTGLHFLCTPWHCVLSSELVQQLLQDMDPDLYRYLEYMQVDDMAFCHR